MDQVIDRPTENNNMEENEPVADPTRTLFVRRDGAGRITGLATDPSDPGAKAASLDDPEVQAFLQDLDLDLVRVLEDVIDLLVVRGVFRFTDLPESAQQKLLYRKTMRSHWQSVVDPLRAVDDLL